MIRLSSLLKGRVAASALALGLAVSACATAPEVGPAAVPDSAAGPFLSQRAGATTLAPVRDDWWRLYDDPLLDALVLQALDANNEIEAAVANLRAVRASLGEARAARLPSTQVSGAGSYGRVAATTVPGSNGEPLDETETYDVGLDVAYEIDLFGRVGSTIAAARADADAAAAALDVIRVSVAAETARAYAEICSANVQIGVAEQTIQLQSRTLELTESLLSAGSGTGLDVARARSAVAGSQAALPPLRAQRDAAVFRLATLIGVTPREVPATVLDCATPPRVSQPIPVGDGAALLARRPDVRQAERQLAAASARVDVATASLYPSISLGGSVGTTATDLSDLGDDGALRFSVGPLIQWSFPNVAVARSRIAAAGAGAEGALARFDQTVLVALQETETALSAYGHALDRMQALTVSRDEAARASRLAHARFEAGADSFLTELDAERTLAQAEAALAQAEAQVSDLQIQLFKALAGSWTPPEVD